MSFLGLETDMTIAPGACASRLPRGRTSGFTVIELLISVTVLVILLALAGPSFSSLTGSTRVSSSSSTLAADIKFARNEAVMRNVPVLVCAKNSSSAACVNSASWQSGWIVCVDANDDGACDTATSDAPNPIRMRPSAGDGVTITGPATPVRFNGTGSATQIGFFSIAGQVAGVSARSIQITTSGYVHTY